jgi:hypothetical protein
LFVFEIGSCYVAQAGLKLTISCLSLPSSLDYRCESPCLALKCTSFKMRLRNILKWDNSHRATGIIFNTNRHVINDILLHFLRKLLLVTIQMNVLFISIWCFLETAPKSLQPHNWGFVFLSLFFSYFSFLPMNLT